MSHFLHFTSTRLAKLAGELLDRNRFLLFTACLTWTPFLWQRNILFAQDFAWIESTIT